MLAGLETPVGKPVVELVFEPEKPVKLDSDVTFCLLEALAPEAEVVVLLESDSNG